VNASAPSLLSFLETPIVVGDPDGRTVFLNGAFEARLRVNREQMLGKPLATLFEGGGREAVLEAVAQVCERGSSVRFHFREQEIGFTALASPITVDEASVGVILMLLEDVLEEEKLLALCREISKPTDELSQCFEELFDQTGGRRSEHFRERVEEGLRSLERLRKWTEELRTAAAGGPVAKSTEECFDPVRVVRDAALGLQRDASGPPKNFEILVPARLPEVRGDGTRFGAALISLLRQRFEESAAASFTLAAKAVGQGDRSAVLISLIEALPAEGGASALGAAETPPLVVEIVSSLGGSVSSTDDEVLGRTTSIRLPVPA
jgi:hypothetical protein